MVDRDRSGYIDENELQQALSSGYQRFSLRTIRLLMFLFKNPSSPSGIGEILSPFDFFLFQPLFQNFLVFNFLDGFVATFVSFSVFSGTKQGCCNFFSSINKIIYI